MRSTPGVQGRPRSYDDIAAAALVCFARDGFDVSLRTVAAEAGVSAALIVHHFGSKQGLRDAVDDLVLGVSEEKLRLYDAEGAGAAIGFVADLMADGNMPRYLARVLAAGDDRGTRLFESFVSVTEKAVAGIEPPLPEPRLTAALLVTHSLGLMTMSEQFAAATGVHPYRGGDDLVRLLAAALGIYKGALAPLLP